MAKGSDRARAYWRAKAAEGYRYDDGYMVHDRHVIDVPPRERRIAKTASREATHAATSTPRAPDEEAP